MSEAHTDLTESNPVPFVPAQTLYRNELRAMGSFAGLNDGRLLYVSDRSYISDDGGESWHDQGPLRLAAGGQLKRFHACSLVRLRSGGLGLIHASATDQNAWARMLFTRSDDEGRTWSAPIAISEPHLDSVSAHHNASTVTSSGRIVVPVYRQIGRRDFVPDKSTCFGQALLGDQWSLVGSHDYEPNPELSWVYYSDDEGQTWQRNANGEMMVTLDYEAGGNWSTEEPTVVEYWPGHLLMLYRTPLGRLFQSWSADDGTNWTLPRPTALASSRAPAALTKIPGTQDLLVIWNQASGDEIQRGLLRHRLSAAISQDGGASWKWHKNIFCIDEDDRSFVEASPVRHYRADRFSPRLPLNHCWATYAAVAIQQDRVILTYVEIRRRMLKTGDTENLAQRDSGPYIMALPLSWLYEKRDTSRIRVSQVGSTR